MFFSNRPTRATLKKTGIVKERVFGCDLGEHLLNLGHDGKASQYQIVNVIPYYGLLLCDIQVSVLKMAINGDQSGQWRDIHCDVTMRNEAAMCN